MKLHNLLRPTLREARADLPGLDDLLQSGIPFVVVGAVARNAYSDRPRNTQDIDVMTKDYEELAIYLQQKYPELEMTKGQAVIRFKHEGKELLDIMVPYNQFFESVLADTRRSGKFDIAGPEALLAMKFAAIMARHRSALQKGQDRLDMASILSGTKVDLERAKRHLALLYHGAPDDFQAFVTKLQQDFSL